MKVLKTVVLAWVLSVCLLTWFDTASSDASVYLGEFCFQYNHKQGSMAGESGVVQVSVYDKGNGIYSALSVVDQNVVEMTGTLKNDKIHISSTDTGWFGTNGAYIVTNYIVLDINTLSGNYRGLDIQAELDSQGEVQFFSGTMTNVQCP